CRRTPALSGVRFSHSHRCGIEPACRAAPRLFARPDNGLLRYAAGSAGRDAEAASLRTRGWRDRPMAAGICQARLSPSQTSESECYMRPGNSAILSSLILARQHALIFAGRDVDVGERRPFRSADHDAAWLQKIEARLERHAVHRPEDA